jgi:hypothetical protein
MRNRTFNDENLLKVLGQALSASYTQSWSQIFTEPQRVVYILIAHASCNVAFNVQIADDASGTNPVEVLGTDITANSAGSVYTIEVGPGILTAAKQYVSAEVVLTAGTYTLLELRQSLRQSGGLTQDTTYAQAEFSVL